MALSTRSARAGPCGAQSDPPARRGLLYWAGDGKAKPRILFTAVHRIYAVDAKTGEACADFGEGGHVALETGGTVAGAIFENVLVIPGYDQNVYGYDAATGKRLWTFHTVPEPGEYGAETWDPPAKGANCWGGMALDEERGIAYISTGSPKPDFLGMLHRGQNLFANCLIALDARTGKRLWHFQEVRHDIWDWDIPAPPMLATIEREGRRIDVVAQVTKIGNTFVLDRVTGKSVYPIRMRRAPVSKLPGEETWPYQPDPQIPAPFTRQEFRLEDVTQRTEAAHEAVMKVVGRSNLGWFAPWEEAKPTVIFNDHGGAEWTGACLDPRNGRLFVSSNEIPWYITLFRNDEPVRDPNAPPTPGQQVFQQFCVACHGPDRRGGNLAPPLIGLRQRMHDEDVLALLKTGRGSMPPWPQLTEAQRHDLLDFLFLRDLPKTAAASADAGFRWSFGGWQKLLDPDGYPGCTPPWGRLNCIDLNTGKIAWQVPLGEYDELTAQGIPKTGTENFGGASVTAGGLVFCAGTRDNKIRAFDAADGRRALAASIAVDGIGAADDLRSEWPAVRRRPGDGRRQAGDADRRCVRGIRASETFEMKLFSMINPLSFIRRAGICLSALLLVWSAQAQETTPLISPQDPASGWSFGNGAEFPGATGELSADPAEKYEGHASLKLSGDFTKGGNYVQAGRKIDKIDIRELSMWLRSPATDHFTLRINDATGQTHQISIKLEAKPDWQRIVLPLQRFFAHRGDADAVTNIAKYESWGGAKDGAWHGPATAIYILAGRSDTQKTPTLWFGALDILSPPVEVRGAEITRMVPLAEILEGEHDWRFSRGEEFAGAKGSLTVVRDEPAPGQSALKLAGDFTGGGAYVAAIKEIRDLEAKDVPALHWRLKSDNAASMTMTIVDGTGQTHQRKGTPIPHDGQWHEITVKPAEIAGGEHWGGANDGKWHGPLKQLALSVTADSDEKNKQPVIYLADLRAEALLPVFAQPAAFSTGFDGAPGLPAGWTATGGVAIDAKNYFKGSGALALSRSVDEAAKPCSATSPSFPVAPGKWQVSLAAQSELQSPDNSYRGIVLLECLDGAGKMLDRFTVAEIFGPHPWQALSQRLERSKRGRERAFSDRAGEMLGHVPRR